MRTSRAVGSNARLSVFSLSRSSLSSARRGLHGGLIKAIFDRAKNRGDLPIELGRLALALGLLGPERFALPLRLLPERLDEGRDKIGSEQPFLQAVENPRLDRLARDRQAIVAGSLLLPRRAGVAVATDDRIRTVTAAAPQQTPTRGSAGGGLR